ncbi:EvpB/family type VI secretion protein [Candidatus Magnetomorum sp. HK-1]|nr:EvpB/family type VI secretion protein [Candidatus Magnetomorum sp. HK-1]
MSTDTQNQTDQAGVTTEELPSVVSLLSKVKLDEPPEPMSLKDAFEKESDSAKMLFALDQLIKDIASTGQQVERLDKEVIDKAISNIDEQISAQVRTIMHQSEFKSLESSWRGLDFAVSRTDFENVQVEILNCPKNKLIEDFNNVGEDLPESGLFKQIYDQAYNQPGANPISFVIANYEIDHTAPDIALLDKMSRVCAASHCPIITSVGSSFFGVNSLEELSNKTNINAIFNENKYLKWRSFRKGVDSKYVGLTMNKFLLRLPYDPENAPAKSFNFQELDLNKDIDSNLYLWGNPVFAFMANLNKSFAKYGWAVNIRGAKSGGKVEDLPIHLFKSGGTNQMRLPCEMYITETKEVELSESGFIPLSPYENEDFAVFFGAHSAQDPGKDNPDDKLAANMPYLFLVSRFSHYLKVIQREEIGSNKEKEVIQLELEKWIQKYVTEGTSEEAKVNYPLKAASVVVDDNPDAPGYYDVTINVRPHFQLEGMNINLSLVSRMPTQ